jgi:hypothetical protein
MDQISINLLIGTTRYTGRLLRYMRRIFLKLQITYISMISFGSFTSSTCIAYIFVNERELKFFMRTEVRFLFSNHSYILEIILVRSRRFKRTVACNKLLTNPSHLGW